MTKKKDLEDQNSPQMPKVGNVNATMTIAQAAGHAQAQRYIVVFDIDGTLCHSDKQYGKELNETYKDQIKSLHPESPITVFRGDRYNLISVWIPYLDVLFSYLIEQNIRIIFFSAGISERNLSVLDQLLNQIFGAEKYSTLKSQGQFEIFSEQHMRKGNRDSDVWGQREQGNYIKDMKVVLKEGEDLANAILVEDQSSYTAYDQRPCINALDVERWDFAGHYNAFQKNGAYYLIGLFKTYFENAEYAALPLRPGIRKLLRDVYPRSRRDEFDSLGRKEAEVYYPGEEWFYIDQSFHDKPFTDYAICDGIKIVKRVHKDALLYHTGQIPQGVLRSLRFLTLAHIKLHIEAVPIRDRLRRIGNDAESNVDEKERLEQKLSALELQLDATGPRLAKVKFLEEISSIQARLVEIESGSGCGASEKDVFETKLAELTAVASQIIHAEHSASTLPCTQVASGSLASLGGAEASMALVGTELASGAVPDRGAQAKTGDFRELVTVGHAFVDKSLFIREVINSGIKAALILRPSGWGKSVNLDMLRRFLSIEVDADGNRLAINSNRVLFESLKISNEAASDIADKKEVSILDGDQGKHPVISISFKEIIGDSYKEVETNLKTAIQKLFASHGYLGVSDKFGSDDISEFYQYVAGNVGEDQLTRGLRFLSGLLWQYHKLNPYILVDDYDAPVNHLLRKGWLENLTELNQITALITRILSESGESNYHLNKIIITGTVDVLRKDIGFCSVRIFDLSDTRFSESFGFSEDEVRSVVQKLGLDDKRPLIEKIRDWYGGYKTSRPGGDVVQTYNSRSVMHHLRNLHASHKTELGGYWPPSEIDSIWSDLPAHKSSSALLDALKCLADGKTGGLINLRRGFFMLAQATETPDRIKGEIWEVVTYLLLSNGYIIRESDTSFSVPNLEAIEHLKVRVLQPLVAKELELAGSAVPQLSGDESMHSPQSKTDDFRELVTTSKAFVDKSLFIQEIIDDGNHASLILRPHGWGKSLNLDMLRKFLSIEVDANGNRLEVNPNRVLFEGLKISKATTYLGPRIIGEKEVNTLERFQGKTPVIFISFKEIVGDSYKEVEAKLKTAMRELFTNHGYLGRSDKFYSHDIKEFYQYVTGHMSDYQITHGLYFLSELLSKYHSLNAYILVDDCDKPVNYLLGKGFYENLAEVHKVAELITSVMSICGEGNPYVSKVILAGTVDVFRRDVGFDKVMPFGLSEIRFSDSFGFSEDEVSTLVNKFGLDGKKVLLLDKIRHYYGGYKTRGRANKIMQAYAPGAVTQYLRHVYTTHEIEPTQSHWSPSEFDEFWSRLSAYELSSDFLDKLRYLADGKSKYLIDLGRERFFELSYRISSEYKAKSELREIATYILFNAGYITSEDDSYFVVPNLEALKQLKMHVLQPWIQKELKLTKSESESIITELRGALPRAEEFGIKLQALVLDRVDVSSGGKTEEYLQSLVNAIVELPAIRTGKKISHHVLSPNSGNIFYPIDLLEGGAVVIHEYKRLDKISLAELNEALDDALWQVIEQGYLYEPLLQKSIGHSAHGLGAYCGRPQIDLVPVPVLEKADGERLSAEFISKSSVTRKEPFTAARSVIKIRSIVFIRDESKGKWILNIKEKDLTMLQAARVVEFFGNKVVREELGINSESREPQASRKKFLRTLSAIDAIGHLKSETVGDLVDVVARGEDALNYLRKIKIAAELTIDKPTLEKVLNIIVGSSALTAMAIQSRIREEHSVLPSVKLIESLVDCGKKRTLPSDEIALSDSGSGMVEPDLSDVTSVSQPLGFNVRQMSADGNCLFHAVKHQLELIKHENAGLSHTELRQRAMDVVAQEEGRIRETLMVAGEWEAGRSHADYVARKRQNKEWGGGPEIMGLATSLSVNIAVIDSNGFKELVRPICEPVHAVVFIFHSYAIHYDSIIGVNDGMEAAQRAIAEIERQVVGYRLADSVHEERTLVSAAHQVHTPIRVGYCFINYDNPLFNSNEGANLLLRSYDLGGADLYSAVINFGLQNKDVSELHLLHTINKTLDDLAVVQYSISYGANKSVTNFMVSILGKHTSALAPHVDAQVLAASIGETCDIKEDRDVPTLHLDTSVNNFRAFLDLAERSRGNLWESLGSVIEKAQLLLNRILDNGEQNDLATIMTILLLDTVDELNSQDPFVVSGVPRRRHSHDDDDEPSGGGGGDGGVHGADISDDADMPIVGVSMDNNLTNN